MYRCLRVTELSQWAHSNASWITIEHSAERRVPYQTSSSPLNFSISNVSLLTENFMYVH